MRPFILASALALFAPAAAHAGMMFELDGPPTPEGANSRYFYHVSFSTLLAEERIEPGDFVTLYDVGTGGGPGVGTLVSVTSASGWSIGINPTGVDAPQTLPNDDPNLQNVTFTYNGPAISASQIISGFQIVSTLSGTALDNYTSRHTDNSGGDAGTKISELGSSLVPAAVPEPATLTLLSAGGVALLARRRRRP
jgi:hypothetical protein